jgi:uncharacterized protein with FMN-binding domain
MDTKNKIFTVVGAIAITAAAGIGGYTLFATPDNSSRAAEPTASRTAPNSTVGARSPASPAANTDSVDTAYKDGTYTASTVYQAPEGHQNSVDATIMVMGGKIAAIDAKGHYTDRESSVYVDSFNGSVSSDATGQSLASYSPSRIGGASLTTAAFDNVLDTIRSKARG